jgi:F-type H+-transporting ATPase subunit beta
MLESGIIKYGDDFMHSMENGGWDLSKRYARNERV